ncbi:hypothetical protein L2E82_12331 [Cichorium intybus]|uniref:Uncharacterized protein n=1 Tax=Cichorium intybus TaxID=13427 RepID=A0ACB9GH12_CICIN|nr:hypothetical protein L2E82_12331 [Cichorium intybus]
MMEATPVNVNDALGSTAGPINVSGILVIESKFYVKYGHFMVIADNNKLVYVTDMCEWQPTNIQADGVQCLSLVISRFRSLNPIAQLVARASASN